MVYTLVIWMGCKNDETTQASKHLTSGPELAKSQCGRCHVEPQPSSLSKNSWRNSVLPEMAYYVGISSSGDKMFNMAEDEYYVLKESRLFPNKPLITQEQWDSLCKYYIDNAPDSLVLVHDQNLDNPSQDFKSSIRYNPSENKASITLVETNPVDNHLFVFKEETKMLEEYDQSFHKLSEIQLSSAVSDLEIQGNQKYVLQMGNMNPNDRKLGKLSVINEKGAVADLIDSLKRPVDLKLWDVNDDGTKDFIICNFGNLSGHLSWYDGSNRQQHEISNSAGPRTTLIKDLDGDGIEELVALFCQGDERISIFYKKGDTFTEEIALRFPPNYGSSYIDLQDINNDGHLDLLYANGDNADFSIEKKPYHGFTIFLNDGQNKFKKAYFYPYPGCSKVVTLDFDKDGDLDFGLISFFPDQLKNGFVLLEQKNSLNFVAKSIPGAENGAWMVMDSDSKNNTIYLGSYNRNITFKGKQVEMMKIKYAK
ncbi:MAG: VCBS repeat-containing protein [Saprospiraceae bacterium]|nr:VCBS repeat-containing protein [Saprospiraceae bacterium]